MASRFDQQSPSRQAASERIATNPDFGLGGSTRGYTLWAARHGGNFATDPTEMSSFDASPPPVSQPQIETTWSQSIPTMQGPSLATQLSNLGTQPYFGGTFGGFPSSANMQPLFATQTQVPSEDAIALWSTAPTGFEYVLAL
jgi:hypothetical protein